MSPNTFDLYVDPRGRAHAWVRLLQAASVKPRGIHNLRSAVDSNLVAAGVSLDLAVCVTGHSREVAERHYPRIDQEKQRQTISKLAELYGKTGANGAGEIASKMQLTLTKNEAKTLKDWILYQLSKSISGANSGANPSDAPHPQLYLGVRKMVEIRGDTTALQEKMENVDVAAVADTAFSADSAISAVFSLILEQILEQESN